MTISGESPDTVTKLRRETSDCHIVEPEGLRRTPRPSYSVFAWWASLLLSYPLSTMILVIGGAASGRRTMSSTTPITRALLPGEIRSPSTINCWFVVSRAGGACSPWPALRPRQDHLDRLSRVLDRVDHGVFLDDPAAEREVFGGGQVLLRNGPAAVECDGRTA